MCQHFARIIKACVNINNFDHGIPLSREFARNGVIYGYSHNGYFITT